MNTTPLVRKIWNYCETFCATTGRRIANSRVAHRDPSTFDWTAK
jgi:hypothetical protein